MKRVKLRCTDHALMEIFVKFVN
ncbi:hypothetical protein B4U80_04211 [Leptotrombidium deliense]|uniref:Uncharacterized protein n=1 Tax=Leptotrombidium deliense TaxID=299467 RepID=A0A443SAY1_9ACAR|nr:hypothetical protein B4U80_04211 [Leptotrombidium deliense]